MVLETWRIFTDMEGGGTQVTWRGHFPMRVRSLSVHRISGKASHPLPFFLLVCNATEGESLVQVRLAGPSEDAPPSFIQSAAKLYREYSELVPHELTSKTS